MIVDMSLEETDELVADLEACLALTKIYPAANEGEVTALIREGLDILIDSIRGELAARGIVTA